MIAFPFFDFVENPFRSRPRPLSPGPNRSRSSISAGGAASSSGRPAMYKLGRGGGSGRGNVKRSLPPPQNLHRPGGRLPVGPSASSASKNRTASGGPGSSAASVSARDETFSLESGDPLNFAAIIRLTPDLVEEIRRVEALGGDVRIKFDPYSNHDSENVIDVGGKEFKFTWSKDTGDLCDIYEQHHNGENGNGLLVESGSSWRKLTVQRILDESTKNQVKMRSEEAERLSKSRKAIILDPTNPSVKNQAKSMVAAAVEGNMRKGGWKHKKEIFKKRKVESDQVSTAVPPKLSIKPGTSSLNSTKSRSPVSPLASPLEQHVPDTSASPLGLISSSKGDPDHNNPIPNLNLGKDMSTNLDKGMLNGVKLDICGDTVIDGTRTDDLQNILISVLSENPRGMSLKELEKAAEESIPNSSKKIGNIIGTIATYQASKYFLKPEMEVESLKQTLESGSSPDINDLASLVETHLEKANDDKFGKQSHSTLDLEEIDRYEMNETVHNFQDPVSDDLKINSDSEDKAGSSSQSGSDSESESSDSESESGSKSKSRSPAGSGSASSSDSESDGSSSNKEGSDVDVDIMTSDDEKDLVTNIPEVVEHKLSPPTQRSKYESENEENYTRRNQVEHVALPQLDLNDFEMCDEPRRVVELEPPQTNSSDGKTSANDVDEPRSSSLNNKHNKLKDGLNEEPEFNKRAPKPKPKRAASSDNFQKRTEVTKRAKVGSLENREAASPEKMQYATPNRLDQKGSITIPNINLQEYRPELHEKILATGDSSRGQRSPDFQIGSGPETQQSGQRNIDQNGRKKMPRKMDKSGRFIDNFGGNRTSSSLHHDDASVDQNIGMDKYAILKNGLPRNTRYENTHENGKYFSEKVMDVSGDMVSSVPDTNTRKSSELYISNGQPSDMNKSDVRSSFNTGKRGALTRELSDLELGEFREVAVEKNGGGVKRQAERKVSSKLQENRVAASENLDLSTSNVKAARTATQEGKSPSNSRGPISGSLDNNYRRTPAGRVLDSAQPAEHQSRISVSQNEQNSRMNHVDSHLMAYEKSADLAGNHEMWPQKEVSLENHLTVQKKVPASMLQNHDSRFSGQMSYNNSLEYDNKGVPQSGHNNVKEYKVRKSNAPTDMADSTKNNSLTVNVRKARDSSSDEDNLFYSKYYKGEPDLKGPIKDFSKYNEYVLEYREKYEAYCSLNKSLEKIRNDFLKVGNDLEQAKRRNMEEYCKIVKKLREMYQQFGEKNKQMKKVFILLHDELKNLKQRIKEFADAYSNE